MSCWMSSSRVQIDLHRPVDLLRDLHGLGDAVHLEPAAEAAAEQMVVDHDLLRRQAGHLARRRPGRGSATWVPTQMSQPSLRTWTVQFIGSIVACARNGSW